MNVSVSLTGNSGLSSRLALFYKPLIINNLKFPNTLLDHALLACLHLYLLDFRAVLLDSLIEI